MGMKRNCFVARAIFFRDDLRLACLNEKRGEASFKVRACQFVFFFLHFVRSPSFLSLFTSGFEH
jgi:hypothetical protein